MAPVSDVIDLPWLIKSMANKDEIKPAPKLTSHADT
jgi:hypothetical protein